MVNIEGEDAYGTARTPLQTVAENEYTDIAEYLLRYCKANVSLTNVFGQNCIHFAAKFNGSSLSTLKLLLKYDYGHKAINAKDYDLHTPYDLALKHNQKLKKSITLLFSKHGGKANRFDKNGRYIRKVTKAMSEARLPLAQQPVAAKASTPPKQSKVIDNSSGRKKWVSVFAKDALGINFKERIERDGNRVVYIESIDENGLGYSYPLYAGDALLSINHKNIDDLNLDTIKEQIQNTPREISKPLRMRFEEVSEPVLNTRRQHFIQQSEKNRLGKKNEHRNAEEAERRRISNKRTKLRQNERLKNLRKNQNWKG
eukprot:g14575.t1